MDFNISMHSCSPSWVNVPFEGFIWVDQRLKSCRLGKLSLDNLLVCQNNFSPALSRACSAPIWVARVFSVNRFSSNLIELENSTVKKVYNLTKLCEKVINSFLAGNDTRSFCGQCRSRSDCTECAVWFMIYTSLISQCRLLNSFFILQ